MIPSPRSSRSCPPGASFALEWLAALLCGSGLLGCGPTEVETTYGRSRGQSINGTNAFADLLRDRGHAVRAAVRYNDVLGAWAQVVVRFAPYPGPPSQAEADWFSDWLGAGPGRRLIYVPRDYEATPEFWTRMLQATPADTPEADRQAIKARRDSSLGTSPVRPSPAKQPASVRDWFGSEPAVPGNPAAVVISRRLDGPWADGVDPAAAAVPLHEAIRAENNEEVLLTGDGKKLVVAWSFSNKETEDGKVLVVANGSFLLNAAMLNQARRPLANRVVDWVGAGPHHVAFVEGVHVRDEADEPGTSPFHLLTVEPFDWITVHLAVFGGLLCWSLAVSLGRPRREPSGETDRASAHPIALGAILARTQQAAVAHDLLATYRRWRYPSVPAPRAHPPSPSSRRVPDA